MIGESAGIPGQPRGFGVMVDGDRGHVIGAGSVGTRGRLGVAIILNPDMALGGARHQRRHPHQDDGQTFDMVVLFDVIFEGGLVVAGDKAQV